MTTKNQQLFDFTTKVLSKRLKSVEPFPQDGHHLLATYLNLCFYILIVPYRVVFNKSTGQYEVRSNSFQKIAFVCIWSMQILQFFVGLWMVGRTSKPNDPLNVLLLLGGYGHVANLTVFLCTVVLGKGKILNLLNLLVSGRSFLSDNEISISSIVKFPDQEHIAPKPNQDPQSSSSYPFTIGKVSFTFKVIGVIGYVASVLAGLRSTAIVDRLITTHKVSVSFDDSAFYNFFMKETPLGQSILNPTSITDYMLKIVVALNVFMEHFNNVSSMMIFGFEVIVSLTMKFICSNFMKALDSSESYMNPSSDNILRNFILVRHACKQMNKLFGWLFFASVMGEFPNITFSLVFLFQNPHGGVQWGYKFALVYEIFILMFATMAVLELSKLKEWLHLEEKPEWTMIHKGTLQWRIILFELSLNKYALYGHGFFQLSLPAVVSIVVGILSNALILIQLLLSA